MSAIEYEGITSVSCSIVGVRFAADSALEEGGFEPSVPLYVSSVHSGACDATHAAIVKPGTPDRARRRAR
jgi:hypothetical protein